MEWGTSTIISRLDTVDCSLAWSKLNNRFRSSIIRFAQQMGLTLEEAEDAAQDTLLTFHETLREGSYDQANGKASTWLFGIAFRQILSRRRKHLLDRKRFKSGQNTSFWDGTHASVDDIAHWEQEWKRAIVNEYLEQVRTEVEPQTYMAFELVARAGKSPQATATTLGMTIKSVYNAKHRILKRLREIREAHEKPIFMRAV